MVRYISLTLLSLALLFSVAVADDVAKKGKGKAATANGYNPAVSLISKIEAASVELTPQQIASITAHGNAMQQASEPIRKVHEIDGKVMKSVRQARSNARQSGLKGEELKEASAKEAGLSETQVAGLAKLDALRKQMMESVASELTDDQRAQLPKNLGGSKGGKRGKGKKKA